jgi:hypothetical protein
MKRSEMINVILEAARKNGLYDAFHGTDEDKTGAAILNSIEEAGMLPPTQSPSLIDLPDGTQKHGPALRVWDEE